MPPTVAVGTNGKPSSRPTRGSKTTNGVKGEGEVGGGGGGGGGGGSPSKKKGGVSGALGDTSSDSESEPDGVEAATGKNGAASSAVAQGVGDEYDSAEEDMDACGICSEPAERPVSSACGHSFCRTW